MKAGISKLELFPLSGLMSGPEGLGWGLFWKSTKDFSGLFLLGAEILLR